MAGTTRKTHTRVIGIVHSHIKKAPFNGVINLSKDIINLSCTKVLKGAGTLSLTLVPRTNYLNYIYPNDVINVYIDNGEGLGFVRTFMGYVDRIERNIAVDEQGIKNTSFRIVSTDITKVLDKTDIYFNPHLNTRKELFGQFASQGPDGQSALRMAGLTIHGTPSEFVENTLQILLGFGTQWKLPDSYPEHFLEENRLIRQQRSLKRIPNRIKDRLSSMGFGNLEDIAAEPQVIDAILNKAGSNSVTIGSYTFELVPELQDAAMQNQQASFAALLNDSSSLKAYKSVLQSFTSKSNSSIMDILDLSFIEAMTTDGYLQSAAIWSGTGSIASFLQSSSNEVVNELFFDLRPVAGGIHYDSCFGEEYSTDPDELKINTEGLPSDGFPASSPAVQYRPAVVFREYPYSVVKGLDLSNYTSMSNKIGKIPFGPVFSKGVNKPGRKLFLLDETLNVEPCAFDELSPPYKHLDVAVIHDSDVYEEALGRSDMDICNLFSMSAQDDQMALYKFQLSEFLPIFTPISVERHGLRVKETATKFANYSRDILCNEGPNATAVDQFQVRQNLIRWTLLIDHWDQHNHEFLSGTIKMGPRPDIRVGYRVDWVERHESYYVESVQHEWAYPGRMTTILQVSRGQRNDPFPAYIPPIMPRPGGEPLGVSEVTTVKDENFFSKEEESAVVFGVERVVKHARTISSQVDAGGGNRSSSGRLADYFNLVDPTATSRSVISTGDITGENEVDKPGNANNGGTAEYAGADMVADEGVLLDPTYSREETDIVRQAIEKKKAKNKKK